MGEHEARRFSYLPLAVVRAASKAARERGVSRKARSRGQFVDQFRMADGDPDELSEHWKGKRNSFCARWMGRIKSARWSVWEDGEPSNVHMTLAVWAYSPTPARMIAWLKERGYL